MAGKCRPSLRRKTLEHLKWCNLSQTTKDCITEVFKRYEESVAEIYRLNLYAETLLMSLEKCQGWDKKSQSRVRSEAITEFAERLKKEAGYFGRAVSVETIDQIAKEMKEKLN